MLAGILLCDQCGCPRTFFEVKCLKGVTDSKCNGLLVMDCYCISLASGRLDFLSSTAPPPAWAVVHSQLGLAW